MLLAQLGTPDAPTKAALRRYLKQFLSDRRVIEVPRLLWWFILNGIILQTRPKRSAKLYARIWEKEGSPLLRITNRQAAGLREKFIQQTHLRFAVGMRYGSPSLESAVDQLIREGCSRILLFPMYPQYAAATSASTYDVVFAHLLKRRWVPTLRVAEPYFRHPAYVQALSVTINESLEKLTPLPDRLVLSYHGVPRAYVEKGDPYCCMCFETTNALLPKLLMPSERVLHTYQSRFGNDPWLEPYTDETIKALGEKGIRSIAVAAPGFTADCLETLDELGNENGHLFSEHGGERFTLIPCLNDHPAWINGMAEIIRGELAGWLNAEKGVGRDCGECPVPALKAGGKI